MQITERDGQRLLTVGGIVSVLAADLGTTLDEAARLKPLEVRAVLGDAGFALPDDFPDRELRRAMISIVQDAWYRTVRGGVPPSILAAHEERMRRFADEIARHRDPADLPELPSPTSPSYDSMRDFVVEIDVPDGPVVYLFLRRPGGLVQTLETFRETHDENLYRLVVTTAGYVVPDGAGVVDIYPVAAGVVQRWWHEAVRQHGALLPDGEIDTTETSLPESYEREQRARYARLLKSTGGAV